MKRVTFDETSMASLMFWLTAANDEELFQFAYCPGMPMFEGVADDGV